MFQYQISKSESADPTGPDPPKSGIIVARPDPRVHPDPWTTLDQHGVDLYDDNIPDNDTMHRIEVLKMKCHQNNILPLH